MAQNKKTNKMEMVMKPSSMLTGLASLVSFDLSVNYKLDNKKEQPIVNYNIDKPFVSNSKKLLETLKTLKSNMSENSLDPEKLDQIFQMNNKLLYMIESVLTSISNECNKPGFTTVQTTNAKTFISNYTESKEILNYLSDYINAVIEINSAKKSLKSAKIYSIEELEELYSEA